MKIKTHVSLSVFQSFVEVFHLESPSCCIGHLEVDFYTSKTILLSPTAFIIIPLCLSWRRVLDLWAPCNCPPSLSTHRPTLFPLLSQPYHNLLKLRVLSYTLIYIKHKNICIHHTLCSWVSLHTGVLHLLYLYQLKDILNPRVLLIPCTSA